VAAVPAVTVALAGWLLIAGAVSGAGLDPPPPPHADRNSANIAAPIHLIADLTVFTVMLLPGGPLAGC
jgi:hypothetical protein